ncbi:MAG: hypothetical protein IPM21_08010 [Acidobacteria bacterium]|nr:hypothetical protein [Acidobacteriota bacterium]
MIRGEELAAILEQYRRHGWEPRRLLFTVPPEDDMISQLPAGTEMNEAAVDAVWFTRRSREGEEAWELRRLSGSPYALVEVIADGTEEPEVEERLAAAVETMAEKSR